MATPDELVTLATWLEQQGLTARRDRELVTLPYLQTVCGHCTPEQLATGRNRLLQAKRLHDVGEQGKETPKPFALRWLKFQAMCE